MKIPCHWQPTQWTWFLHPTEAPKRLLGQARKIREWTGFFWRKLFGIEVPVEAVNIGGGPQWCRAGWRNLDEAQSIFNPVSFRFSPDCRFPLESRSIPLAYTSHCLEHLDDATVDRILAETHRVLKPSGKLLIKLPDFDEVLRRWQAGDQRYATDYRFNYNSVRRVWKAAGVEENTDMKYAFIFCHYWNQAYGHHYAGKRQSGNGAYLGPPIQPPQVLRTVTDGATPHEASHRLREMVTRETSDMVWGHQNAWSRAELKDLLSHHGFDAVSFDRDALIRSFKFIPDIRSMDEQSFYCLAVKKSAQGTNGNLKKIRT